MWADSGLGCGCHCAALGNLAANSPENQRAIAAAGGVVAVVGAMRAHPAAAGVQQRGCFGAWAPGVLAGAGAVCCWLRVGFGGGRAEIVSLCGYSALNCPRVGIRITRTVGRCITVFADSGIGCRCTAMYWFVDDMGMRAQIHQQGGGELARAAKARFPGQGDLVEHADEVIKYA